MARERVAAGQACHEMSGPAGGRRLAVRVAGLRNLGGDAISEDHFDVFAGELVASVSDDGAAAGKGYVLGSEIDPHCTPDQRR